MNDTVLAEVRARLLSNDARGAFRAIAPVVEYPADSLRDVTAFGRAFSAFTEVARVIAGSELGDTIAAVAEHANDVDALYSAAYALYEHKLHGVAATLLDRANRLVPGSASIVAELAANLEALLRYGDAARAIDASGLVGNDLVLTYLSGFSSLMCGDVDGARARLHQLTSSSGDTAHMRDELAGMVHRACALREAKIDLGEHSLTAWHAIINGTLLLHESPYGYDQPMRGRYAYISDSPSLMHEGIDRLRLLLAKTGRRVGRVVAAPDRASLILAHAASSALNAPLEPWSPGAASDGLFVAWDMDCVANLDFLKAQAAHAPDQILFVHASAWVHPFSYAPDVTTLLYQTITHPYTGGSLRVDQATGDTVAAPPDTRDDGELGAEILHGPGAVAPEGERSAVSPDTVLTIAAALASLSDDADAIGLQRRSGSRRRQRAGSPVASARFT